MFHVGHLHSDMEPGSKSLFMTYCSRSYLCVSVDQCVAVVSTQLNLANMSMTSSKDNVTSSDDDSDADEETATKDLSFWRSAVASATSSAQLCLYTMQLNKCIAWEKSIMKVVSALYYHY